MKTLTNLLQLLTKSTNASSPPSSPITVWDTVNNSLLVFDNESALLAWLSKEIT
jgi:hypothetical protein